MTIDQARESYLHKEATEAIIGAAIAVHNVLKAGLLESIYEACVAHEFVKRGIPFQRQLQVPVVERFLPVHEAQLNTYMRPTGKRVGSLINVNSIPIRDGIHRRVLSLKKQYRTPCDLCV